MGRALIFRCDASPTIGAGHVMRCLASAETLAWLSWSVSFVTSQDTPQTVPALPASGFTLAFAEGDVMPQAEVAVFDHYGLGADVERAARRSAAKVVAFDDLPTRAHDADVLLDPTPSRAPDAYCKLMPAGGRILVGAQFAQIRRAWRIGRRSALDRRARTDRVRRILVSMGATDPHNATAKALAAIRTAKITADIDIVLGPAAPHARAVAADLKKNERLHIDPPNLVALAIEADLAVGAPGSSSFERACVGLPAVLVPLADNQRDLARSFAESGAAEVLAPEIADDAMEFGQRIAAVANAPERLAAMSAATAALVDGRGPLRLAGVLAGESRLRDGRTVRLRLAEPTDDSWLLALQHQPETRRFARNPEAPSAEGHARWMVRTLDDPERLLAIVEADGTAVGMVRLDWTGAAFEVSIAIDQGQRGRGLGSSTLALVRRLAPAADLVATVLPENRASIRLFSTAGYRSDGPERYRSRAV